MLTGASAPFTVNRVPLTVSLPCPSAVISMGKFINCAPAVAGASAANAMGNVYL